MARKKSTEPKQPKAPTAEQEEIRELTALGRDGRTPEQTLRLKELHDAERRERWNRVSPKRRKKLLVAVRHMIACSNDNAYLYDTEEAKQIVDQFAAYAERIKQAFGGGREEKGMYDL